MKLSKKIIVIPEKARLPWSIIWGTIGHEVVLGRETSTELWGLSAGKYT